MLLFVLFALAALPAPVTAATVERVAVEGDRIVIRFDEAVERASSFLVDAPRRIAVDVSGASPGGSAAAGGAVAAVRQAPRGGGGTRIVFDLAEPRTVTAGRFANGGRELVLSLGSVGAGAFASASMSGPLRFLWPAARPTKPGYKLSIPVPPPARSLPLPRVRGDDDRPLVVIDAGHGGVDPGAINPVTGLREKDVTLRIAKAIRDELLKTGRVRVALTREDDRFLILQERYGIGRRLKADLFISIHCDSAGSDTATGASVYTLSEVASDKQAARLAARENKADIIAGVDLGGTSADVSSILIDLTQRETMNSSAGFARLLGREAKPLIPTKAIFHRMASLMVLKAPDMPSVLLETGYLSNAKDADFIDSEEGRARIARSVRQATDAFFARRMASR